SEPLRIAIAGLGTVGAGLVDLLQRESKLIAARAGRPIVISAISARDRSKDRGVDLASYAWEDDPVALASRADVDVVVELMGGHEGAARQLLETAIAQGKDIVTANKALLAHHGHELALKAEANGHSIRFEAAVAGGIPVIKALTEGLAGNRITRVMGVMNGTCNYILTRMQATGQGYNALFEECAKLGYLEADPNLDVGGIDAGHKLALLAAIAFGTRVNFPAVELEGIQRITLDDIHQAADMGFRIKLLGVAQITGRGLEQHMSPCLVAADSPLGQLEGGTNGILIEGEAVGQIFLRGAGAGAGPTASAVLADLIDLARGIRVPTFGQPATTLDDAAAARAAAMAPWYLRMRLVDKPGALAKVAAALGDAGVSIDRMRQYGHSDDAAPVLIVTHKATRSDIDKALALFEATGVVVGTPVTLRIQEV
ncbi:MAG: homoserine dehydrogenase, partial [Deltaproteobacteria bacterium]